MWIACVDAYQTLPDLLPGQQDPLVFLVWSTNAYQPPDLGLSRPSICFTNHYHREGGQGIDLGVDQTDRMGRTVKGGVVRWLGSRVRVM